MVLAAEVEGQVDGGGTDWFGGFHKEVRGVHGVNDGGGGLLHPPISPVTPDGHGCWEADGAEAAAISILSI
jgi:hypothetical protein